MPYEYHTPAMVYEVLHYLHAEREGVFVDGTLGGGGHSELILTNTSSRSRLIGFDRDKQALSFSSRRLKKFGDRVTYIHDDFSNMKQQLEKNHIGNVDGVLLDLGVSSHQLDSNERGFSFQRDGRLDMRMDQDQRINAGIVVNTYSVQQLADIFREYAEERNAKRIARRIVESREQHPIETTRQLSCIVESTVGGRLLQKSLARVFQAIRIEVNNELEHLHKGIRNALECLHVGGRLVVISYHSLEDRIVKKCFLLEANSIIRSNNKLLPDIQRQPRIAVLTKKPVRPGDEEIARNPRSRSAKLRAAEKVAA